MRRPAHALDAGSPALAPRTDVAFARGVLARFEPPSAAQARVRARMLAFVDAHPADAHQRSSLTGHLTASALVLDADGERGLLCLHAKLGRWLQLGGHCDGDANLPAVALREALEESGVAGVAILPTPVDLDVHTIPARPGEPEHLHLDTRFLAFAPPGAVPVVSPEAHELAWFTPADLARIATDDSVRRLFRIAFGAP